MSQRYYTPEKLAVGEFPLTGPEAHHLSSVCRAKPGDKIVLFNGDGNDYSASIVTVSKKQVYVHIEECVEVRRELVRELVIASAVPKGDRADFLLEKLTELGVTRFIPVIWTRSVVTPKGIDKFERAVIEASKQCGRNVLMKIDPPLKGTDLLQSRSLPESRILLHPGNAGTSANPGGATLVAIGPEGGCTDDEVESAIQNGWQTRTLGPRILRIETAAIAAAALFGLADPGMEPLSQ